jgi:nucleoside-triphosphatase THEP1
MAERTTARVALVVGSRNSGKTGYARAVVERARAAGLRVAGFFSDAEWDGGVKARFYLEDITDPDRRLLLASVDPGPELEIRTGPYHLSGEAFAAADRSLRGWEDSDLVCIDEVGPLEMRGGGFRPALDRLLAGYRGVLLLTCRPSVAAELSRMAGMRG